MQLRACYLDGISGLMYHRRNGYTLKTWQTSLQNNMKRRTLWITCALALIVVCAGAGVLWAFTHNAQIATRVIDAALHDEKGTDRTVGAIVPRVLGFDRPNTVLFLFLNNTELRPGGGFVGSYGVITFDHGVPTAMKIGDTQVLDDKAPKTFVVEPPEALKTYLQQPRWFFRDANWSPDFVTSAQRELQFYAAEGGEQADQIHTIIGITPDVLSRIMKYTGPITIEGATFTSENVTDLIEYSVEVGFLHKQIAPQDRKAIMGELAKELAVRMATLSPTKWGPLLDDAFRLIKERHIMVYDVEPRVQKTLDTLGWSGRLLPGTPDKLQIVDANLAALKTDRVIDRAARYELAKDAKGQWQSTVTVTYKHSGGFDWRTTRYRTYVRAFVPAGATFLGGDGAMEQDKSANPGTFHAQKEDGFLSVGAFVSVEPGTTKSITFRFTPSPDVLQALAERRYGLLVQKQAGVPQFHLTIHHDFGTSIGQASPPEAPGFFGDNQYDWQGDIFTDQAFTINW